MKNRTSVGLEKGGMSFEVSAISQKELKTGLEGPIEYARAEGIDDVSIGTDVACWLNKDTFIRGGVGHG
ncbi:MAG: hypothetical protein GY809_22970, partial [Planctomycetes bacterium]|nr:hypothetical protein [Planctomycetota bacterium]